MTRLRPWAPPSVKRLYHRLLKHPYLMRRYRVDNPKLAEELLYWDLKYRSTGGRFKADWYEAFLLEIAGEPDASFVEGKVVADFGCGPRGSLLWARRAARRIGIDVLAPVYARLFGTETQNMQYVASTEASIPVSDASVDVLFCVNALDHTRDPVRMAAEMLRILKPGGTLIGSFNLNLRPTVSEPSPLTAEFLTDQLLDHLELHSVRIVPRGPAGDPYRFFRQSPPRELAATTGPGFMWVRGRKKASTPA